jgi:hypothetical protein
MRKMKDNYCPVCKKTHYGEERYWCPDCLAMEQQKKIEKLEEKAKKGKVKS